MHSVLVWTWMEVPHLPEIRRMTVLQLYGSSQSRTLDPETTYFQNRGLADLVADNLTQLDPEASHAERMKQLTLSIVPIVRQVGGVMRCHVLHFLN